LTFPCGRQALALIDELESATKLVDLGVGELHALSFANDFFHLPMQLLALGLERFLKLTYAMAVVGDSGRLPDRKHMKRVGHDLADVTDRLVRLVEAVPGYASRPAVSEDLIFIRDNVDFRRVLALLSDFAKEGRYHRLDEFLDPDSVDVDHDPYRTFESLEMEFVQRQPDWVELIEAPEGARELQRKSVLHLAYLIDRFARAIARMWTLGALPDECRRFSALVRPFLGLGDDQLGKLRRAQIVAAAPSSQPTR
jgi:hypothetical protein